jgi:hypothetical protein
MCCGVGDLRQRGQLDTIRGFRSRSKEDVAQMRRRVAPLIVAEIVLVLIDLLVVAER